MKRCYSCFKEYDNTYTVCPYCGQVEYSKAKEPIHLTPGTILSNRYIIGLEVGSGGFGIVYKAWDMKLETIVAVKEFFVSRLMTRAEGLKNLIVSKKSYEEYEYRKERFLAEARDMAKFGAHKNIPNVFEYFEENNTAYIVMELLQGASLSEYIKQNGGMIDIDFALMITNEVGNALRSLHEKNIIHRDVAPDNIYICSGKELRIKLMDLGAAKLADVTDDVIDIVLKPGYSPTEQYDNSDNIGPWTDIYALGATLYVMLTGVKPDESTNRKQSDEVRYPHMINPAISENLSNSIMKAMALDIHMRFKNVEEFLKAINGERKVVSLVKERKRRNRKRIMSVLAACLVLLVGAGMVLGTYFEKKSQQYLKPADITVWFAVEDGSSEENAMKAMKEDFEKKFPDVTVELKAFPENEYEAAIENAIKEKNLPTLFESTGLSKKYLKYATDLDEVIKSEQFKNALFLSQYNNYYDDKKQMPLAIEVPLAYVITNGATKVDYAENYFTTLKDFGEKVNVSVDERYADLIDKNFGNGNYAGREQFFNDSGNTSAVLLSSTMILNEVREFRIYEKAYVYYNANEIYCNFTYEWSIGSGEKNEITAAERLLSWMLGNVYQNTLMVSQCSDGQIPVNATCFESKITSIKYLSPIKEIYNNFKFEKEE